MKASKSSKDLIGEQAQWLQENMSCSVQLFEGTPVAIELPAKVTLQIVEAEPVVRGQTASSSYKTAKLENGARVVGAFHTESWGDFTTYFAFHAGPDGKFTQLDIGQV